MKSGDSDPLDRYLIGIGLKGNKAKPKIKPSKLEPKSIKPQDGGKRPGSAKRKKTDDLESLLVLRDYYGHLPALNRA